MKTLFIFLCGFPKCGTTSLFIGLLKNKNINVTIPKEPFFFGENFKSRAKHFGIKSFQDYLACFYNNSDHVNKINLDATTCYILNRDSINEIIETIEDPKFIILIRDPISALCAWHDELTYAKLQPKVDINEAIQYSLSRPNKGQHSSFLELARDYVWFVNFGKHIDYLRSRVSDSSILIIDIDEFSLPTQLEKKLSAFLKFNVNLSLNKINERKEKRFAMLHWLLRTILEITISKRLKNRILSSENILKKLYVKIFIKKPLICTMPNDISSLNLQRLNEVIGDMKWK